MENDLKENEIASSQRKVRVMEGSSYRESTVFINYFFISEKKSLKFWDQANCSRFCVSQYAFFHFLYFFLSFFLEKRDHTSTCLEVSGKEIT